MTLFITNVSKRDPMKFFITIDPMKVFVTSEAKRDPMTFFVTSEVYQKILFDILCFNCTKRDPMNFFVTSVPKRDPMESLLLVYQKNRSN